MAVVFWRVGTVATLLSVLLACFLTREANGVISGPKFPRNNGVIEPQVMEIKPEDGTWLPSRVRGRGTNAAEYADFKESLGRLHKRQTESNSSDHLGTAFALEGDDHRQAVVHWTGHPSEAIFVLTRKVFLGHSTESWLWRSTDNGASFHNETNKVDDSAVLEWYYISAQNNILIFTDRINSRIYVTENEGGNYTGYDTGFRPDRLTFQNPSNPGNITEDLWPMHVLGYDSLTLTLYASRNLGKGGPDSWIPLGTNVTRYTWRSLNSTFEDDTAVYFEKKVNETHAELWVASDPYNDPHIFDPDLGPFEINSFVLSHEYMLVQKNTSNGRMYSSPLWVSRNRTTFLQAEFPLQKQEKHYSLVDASEGQVFIAVYHDANNTNLYLSEEAGLKYSLSLKHIVSPPEFQWIFGLPTFDVHVVEGVVGTYVANRKLEGSSYGATVISFDKGGEWTSVSPPAVDYHGNPVNCYPPSCSLHLHMDSDEIYGFQAILSQDSAVGLIMALGNLGSNLQRFNISALRMYFSHDGGFTWREVNEGFWEFQFSALGSIVATVQKYQPTNFIRWTCDEGAEWTDTTFENIQDVKVVGMRTERGEKARHVTAFGYVDQFTEWIVIDIDFQSVVPNQCVKPDDYYIWEPTDERPGSRCLLGETIEYERRKSEICCYIDPEYERPIERNPCVCAVEDFECDFGFEQVNLNSPCTSMSGFVYPPLPPNDCPEGGTYSYTSGYRKVAGDKCIVGNETYFLPIERPCPILAPQGLFVQVDHPTVAPGANITFTLTQVLGGKLFTNYTWNFGDGSAEVVGMGYDGSRIQKHSYSLPGEYLVTVTAINVGGKAAVTASVSVLDPIATVTIVLPDDYSDGSLPSRVELVFSSTYTTLYGTNLTGTIVYSWNFDDGGAGGSAATVTHTYRQAMNTTVILSVHNFVGDTITAVTHVVVYVVVNAEHVRIESDGVLKGEFVKVGEPIKFSVTTVSDLEVIPEDTTYQWYILLPDGSNSTSAEAQLLYDFPQRGDHDITVTGTYAAGSFSKSIHIVAEYEITKLDIAINPTVIIRRYTSVNFTVQRRGPEDSSLPYMGPMTLTAMESNGSSVLDSTSVVEQDSKDGFKQLLVSVKSPGEVELMFTVTNDVSEQNSMKTVNVAVYHQYGSVRFLFKPSNLPAEYTTDEWQTELKNNIIATIMSKYDLEPWQVQVEVQMVLNDTTAKQVKRASENELLAADTIILPTTLNSSETEAIVQDAEDLVKDANAGNVKFTVAGEEVQVDEGVLDPDVAGSVLIVVPTVETETKENTTLYLALGLGLGLGLVLVLAFAGLMVYVTWRYHRKYSRLNVRYSRLQQTPVRFTFTEGGEMMEEEEEEEEEEEGEGEDIGMEEKEKDITL